LKQQKGFYQKKRNRKERGKDETLFEVDTLLQQCVSKNVMECYISFTANRLSRDYIDLLPQLKLRQKNTNASTIEGYQPKTDYRVEKMMVTQILV
jgi:hypothetical protein